MSAVEGFLTAREEEEIVAAIRQAERKTSGEIRVHIEGSTQDDLMEHTKEIFHFLKMDNTRYRNGVLIYIAVKSHKFCIYGDQGINEVVPKGFWDSTRDKMQEQFKKGAFKEGIIEGILNAGAQLQKYFPWEHDMPNELPDQLSKGHNP